MSLEQLNKMIDEAIKHGEYKPHAMKQTNILNASYANGEIMALLNVIKNSFGYEPFIKAYERIMKAQQEFLDRTQELYK